MAKGVQTVVQDVDEHIEKYSEMGSIFVCPHDGQLLIYFAFFNNRLARG